MSGRDPAVFVRALLRAAGIVFVLAAALYGPAVATAWSARPSLTPAMLAELRLSRLALLATGLILLALSAAVKRARWCRSAARRPLAGRLVLLVLSALGPLALVELTLRPLVDRQGARLFVRDAELGWRLRPGTEDDWGGTVVRINSHGLRGPETTWAKPAGTRRILFLGDSVTFGYGLDSYRQAFPHLVEVALERELGGDIESLNAGVGGYSPWQHLRYLEREGLRYSPDLVVVSFVLNDVTEKLSLARFGGRGEGFHLSRSVADTFVDRLAGISATAYFARRLGARIRFGGDVEAGAREKERLSVRTLALEPDRADVAAAWETTLDNLGALFDLCRQHDVPAVLVVFPFVFQFADPEGLAAPQEEVLSFAAERGIPVLDLLPILHRRSAAEGRDPDGYFRDPSHLNPAGSRVVAEAIADAVLRTSLMGDAHGSGASP